MATLCFINVMSQLKVPSTLQGQPHVKGTAVVQSGGHEGISDHEQGPLVQDYMQRIQSLKLWKDPLSLNYECITYQLTRGRDKLGGGAKLDAGGTIMRAPISSES